MSGAKRSTATTEAAFGRFRDTVIFWLIIECIRNEAGPELSVLQCCERARK